MKDWLFGGSHIPVSNALFDVEHYDGAIVADLFGEERYFADSEAFWSRQSEAIAEKRQAYLDSGWGEVVVLDVGQHFLVWNHRKVAKRTLAAHSPVTDMLGEFLAVDMRQWWTPDQSFFDLLRDKGAINAMLREVAGGNTADAHVASTAKVQKKIIADCLSGEGRTKVEGWLPRYMAFPAESYTGRFGEEPFIPASNTDADGEADLDAGIDEAVADAA